MGAKRRRAGARNEFRNIPHRLCSNRGASERYRCTVCPQFPRKGQKETMDDIDRKRERQFIPPRVPSFVTERTRARFSTQLHFLLPRLSR